MQSLGTNPWDVQLTSPAVDLPALAPSGSCMWTFSFYVMAPGVTAGGYLPLTVVQQDAVAMGAPVQQRLVNVTQQWQQARIGVLGCLFFLLVLLPKGRVAW